MEKSSHYSVQLKKPLSSEKWFGVLNDFKQFMKSNGFRIEDFGDGCDLDRKAYLERKEIDFFDGFVIQIGKDENWKKHTKQFFKDNGLEVKISDK